MNESKEMNSDQIDDTGFPFNTSEVISSIPSIKLRKLKMKKKMKTLVKYLK